MTLSRRSARILPLAAALPGRARAAKQLHPAAFSDVDPAAELRRYHKRFLPVAFEGTWMARLTPGPA